MTDLTDRQLEVKSMLDRGLGARAIAESLGITRNAVYQQIQRLRRNGHLSKDYTPTGLPKREQQPGHELLRNLLLRPTEPSEAADAAATMALVHELRRTRDQLDDITSRLSSIVPR